jgi:NTE family protein
MKLLDYVPEDVKRDPLVKELAGYSCKTRMHVVRLLAPRLESESHTKDIDFSSAGISTRWEGGYADTITPEGVLALARWSPTSSHNNLIDGGATCVSSK